MEKITYQGVTLYSALNLNEMADYCYDEEGQFSRFILQEDIFDDLENNLFIDEDCTMTIDVKRMMTNIREKIASLFLENFISIEPFENDDNGISNNLFI